MTTTLRAADGRAEIAVNNKEREAASGILEALKETSAHSAVAVGAVSLPTELVGLVNRVLTAVARGERITVGTVPDELTTSVAATQLGISRPTLMKLLVAGEIPSHKVGSHTRIKTDDVVAFRKRRLESQRAAFEQLRALDEELGLK